MIAPGSAGGRRTECRTHHSSPGRAGSYRLMLASALRPEHFRNRLLGDLKCLRKLPRFLTAGLSKIRPAAAAAAHRLRHRPDPLAGANAALLQLLRDAGDQRDLVVALR